jgi:hypothetical protein
MFRAGQTAPQLSRSPCEQCGVLFQQLIVGLAEAGVSDLALGFAVLATLILMGNFAAYLALRERVAASRLAAWIGAVVGFMVGAASGLLGFYFVYMVPQGRPLGLIDQGVLIIWLTGPLGAVLGALVSHRSSKR